MVFALLSCGKIPMARPRVRFWASWQRERLRLGVGIPVAADHRGGKAVSPPHHGFYETRLLGVVPQRQADLADGSVNAMVDVVESVLAPKALGDLLARHQLPASLDQQDEQFHGELFETQEALAPLQPVLRLVEYEIAEMEFLGRKSSTRALTYVGAMMPQNPLASKLLSNLAVQQNFTSSSLHLHCMPTLNRR
jgi:hypothetical protein